MLFVEEFFLHLGSINARLLRVAHLGTKDMLGNEFLENQELQPI